MDRDQARRYVKEQMEDYLTQKGLNLRKPFHCLNPEHPDKKPSMSFDRRRNKVHCFACGVDYDIFDLIGLDHGLREPAEIFQKAFEIYEVEGGDRGPRRAEKRAFKGKKAKAVEQPTDSHIHSSVAVYTEPKSDKDYAEYYQQVQARLGETDYPEKRGLSLETCRRFGLGFDPEFGVGLGGAAWRALIIPTGPGSYTARNTDPALWSSNKPVFVVEGEIDALSLEEVGGPAVALGSTANVGAFLKIVESRPPDPGPAAGPG